MTPGVNVLVAASRSDHPHHPHHPVARAWLVQAVAACANGAVLTLMPVVVAGFLRLLTSARVFKLPTPMDQAVDFIDALLRTPGVWLAPLGAERPVLRQLCLAGPLSGNDGPDAWLAAATLHGGEHLVTFDRDFKRWLGRSPLTLLAPLAA